MASSSRRKRHRSKKKTPQPLSDGPGDAQFTKALKVTGTDGYLDLIGEYHMKDDLFEGFPRYEKIGVDPKRRRQRRFLTHFNLDMGHWVFSDWDVVLLLGPLANKHAAPKSPDKYEGKYEVCKEARRRCKGVVNIRVKPLKTPSNAATSSSFVEQQQPMENPNHGANEDDTDSSDYEVMETDGITICKKHRLEVCEECGVDNVQNNKAMKKIFEEMRYTDENGFWYCLAHRKEICGICFESHSHHNELLRARKPGQEVNEDTRAVRERLIQQMLDTLDNGTGVESDDDDDPSCVELPAADRKKKCEYCGKKGTFKCKRCNFTYYCSRAHQAAHKAKHQIVCDQLEGVKLTHQMENLLRFIGPPLSNDDIDGDGDMDAYFNPHLMSMRSCSGYTNDQRYQGSYEDALMNAIDFEPDASDPRFWGASGTWDDDDVDEDEDEWVTDEEENEESDTSKSKTTTDANASVSQMEDSSSPSLNLTRANGDSSASELKANSTITRKDSGSSSASDSKLCAHCGEGGKLSVCSRCKSAFYCSKEHQQAHYPTHKRGCRQPSKTQQTAALPANGDSSASDSKFCAHCGEGGKLSVCSRCKSAFYCSKEHQQAHYPTHKRVCRQLGETQQTAALPTKKSGVKVTTWEQLEQAEPFPLHGRTLEIRIISQPHFLRGVCDGRDSRGQVRRLAFYCKSLPKGLKMGCVLRWRNPLFHYFMDGSSGVRIEDEDLPFVTCSDN